LQTVQEGENMEEPTESFCHVLLYHLSANTQADQCHKAQSLQTQCRTSLHSTRKAEHRE